MSKNEVAIAVDGITKIYKLYDRISDRMREALDPFGEGLVKITMR